MKRLSLFLSLVIVASSLSAGAATLADRTGEAISILAARQGSTHPIPTSLLKNAKGVAIIKVTQVGLVFGGSGGQGVVVVRKPSLFGSGWSAPSSFDVSGGSFGAQIGAQTKRFVLVINSEEALHLFTGEGKVKWDATAAGTAGGDTAKESESQLAALPIIVYQDTDGVFGGATFGGTTLSVNDDDNKGAYGPNVYVRDIVGGKVKAPPFADRLYDLLNGKR